MSEDRQIINKVQSDKAMDRIVDQFKDLSDFLSPAPKPVATPKKKPTSIRKVSNKDVYACSDGSKVSQAYINAQLTKVYAKGLKIASCEACGGEAEGHSHIVKQNTLKKNHTTELIWTFEMFVYECHSCNRTWDSALPEIEDQKNVVHKMCILYLHDKPGFWKRFDKFSNFRVMQAIKNQLGI